MRPHILVVDDSDEVRLLASRILEREGYQVSAADSGVSALAELQSVVPDLVVSDIMMPEVDGYRLLERMREDPRLLAVPVIFLSALGDATSLERGNRLGVEHYLVKPFTAKQLLATVSGTLRRYAELRRVRAVTPRAAPTAEGPRPLDFEPTGIAPLDEQVGGLCRGRVYLGQGAGGGAKGVFAVQFLHRALERGDGAVLVTTERVDTVLYVGSSVGLDLRPHIRSGKLVVVGLAERFEYALETRNDVVALAAEIASYAAECRATRIVINSVLTILCSAPRLVLSAPLMTDLVDGLERTGATTLVLSDDPVTPQEELANAYLKRASFGTLILGSETNGRQTGTLKLERMHGVTAPTEGRPFRIAFGTGLVTVDPEAAPHVYDELEELRRHIAVEMASAEDEVTGLVATAGGALRLRDPFALFLRDCVAAALKATERCALLVARFGFEANGEVIAAGPVALTPQDFPEVLAGQEILCWLHATEIAVVALGASADDVAALAARLQDWLAGRGRGVGRTLVGFRAATAAYSTDGATIDELLENLARALGREEGAAKQVVA
ncbi:MAG: response regulator [Deltaproteobacteria bacterium]|nr:response regulator [Deltaproteobacteria bacterium]